MNNILRRGGMLREWRWYQFEDMGLAAGYWQRMLHRPRRSRSRAAKQWGIRRLTRMSLSDLQVREF